MVQFNRCFGAHMCEFLLGKYFLSGVSGSWCVMFNTGCVVISHGFKLYLSN